MIRKIGNKFVLFSKDGKKRLGTFNTRADAEKREREIMFFKNKRK